MRKQALTPLLAFTLALPAGAKSHPKAATPPPTCPATFDDGLDKNGIATKDETGVSPAKVTFAPEAETSEEARRYALKNNGLYASSIIFFVIDKDGATRDLCLQKAAGLGLDANAAKAIAQYRFTPATKDGKTVATRSSAEIRFML